MSTLPPWSRKPQSAAPGVPPGVPPGLPSNRPAVSDIIPPQKPMLGSGPAPIPQAPPIPGAPEPFSHPAQHQERNIAAVKARKRAMLEPGMPPPPPQMPQAAPEVQGDMRERKRRMIERGGF